MDGRSQLFRHSQGWLYLTLMLDLFGRQVVGWPIRPRMAQHLVVDTLRIAWFWRRPEPELIVLQVAETVM